MLFCLKTVQIKERGLFSFHQILKRFLVLVNAVLIDASQPPEVQGVQLLAWAAVMTFKLRFPRALFELTDSAPLLVYLEMLLQELSVILVT